MDSLLLLVMWRSKASKILTNHSNLMPWSIVAVANDEIRSTFYTSYLIGCFFAMLLSLTSSSRLSFIFLNLYVTYEDGVHSFGWFDLLLILSITRLILSVSSPIMWLRLPHYQQENFKFSRVCVPLLWEQLTCLCLRYCNQYVDQDALLYLILVNDILHGLHPNVVTIAEDVSNWMYILKH